MNPNLAIYLIIGAVIWLLLERAGIVGDVYRTCKARGSKTALVSLFLFTIGMLLLWPFFLFYVAIEVMRPAR